MFKELIKKLVENYLQSNYVTCYECKCLVSKNDSQIVQTFYYANSSSSNRFYCLGHKKSYDLIQSDYYANGTKPKYFRKKDGYSYSFIEVTEDGKEVKNSKE